MQSIDDAKAFFSERPFQLSPKEILVLKGILSGDGDIGGRMASSSAAAKAPVDADRMQFIKGVAGLHVELGTSIADIESIHSQHENNPA
jgi:hypothetical protein